MIIQQAALPILIGIGFGTLLVLATGRYLQSLLSNVGSPALATYLACAGLLVFVGVVIAWLATARIGSLDPMEALRVE
jgi:ABC-type antimicrobial peptide transport system permease subunit